MAATKRWRLVCYDVRDPARWRDVYRIVTGHGERVQYSIYRARLDEQQVAQLRWELAKVMEPEDSLLIIDLCPRCAASVISRNHVEGWQDSIPTFRVFGGNSAPSGQAPVHAAGSEEREFQNPLAEERDKDD